MGIEFVTGDLFSVKADGYAHGCNCKGVMGAGIAVEFRKRYPEMFKEYKKRCEDGSFNLGSCFFWDAPSGETIYNLATQPYPGAYASLEVIKTALQTMLNGAIYTKPLGHRIAMPRIGCGYGGLSWEEVKPLIEHVVSGQNYIDVVVVSL